MVRDERGEGSGMSDATGQLGRAARTVSLLTYASGFAGTAAGTILYVEGELALAVLVWVLVFTTGGTLAAMGMLLRWASEQERRTRRLIELLEADAAGRPGRAGG